MIAEEDGYGAYASCLTCGYVREEIESLPVELLEEEAIVGRYRRRHPQHGKIKL